jgi:hypothetical protein
MRRAFRFYWECLKEAFRGSFSLANAWSGLWGPILVWLSLKWRGYTMTLPEHLDAYALLVLLAFLGSTWVGLIIVRFLNAPVKLSERKQREVDNLRSANVILNERLRPRIRLFLDDRTNGVAFSPTDIDGRPGPDSKWVQFCVSCATDAPLVDCEAFLISAYRLDDDGNTASEQLVEEDVNCCWSQQSEKKLTIHPLRTQKANLFSLHDTTPVTIKAETSPTKVRLRDAIQTPGRYRLKVLVTAKSAQPKEEFFIFEWRNFSHVTIGVD